MYVFIYLCIYLNTAHITGRFMAVYKSLWLLGEIERQLVKAPLAAAFSPYFDLTPHPTHAWRGRPPHRELRALLFSTSVWVL